MPVCVRKINDRWRLIECDTGNIARNRNNKPIDGGGHRTESAARRQQTAINSARPPDVR